jgi:hypothetical protein
VLRQDASEEVSGKPVHDDHMTPALHGAEFERILEEASKELVDVVLSCDKGRPESTKRRAGPSERNDVAGKQVRQDAALDWRKACAQKVDEGGHSVSHRLEARVFGS